MFWLLSTDRAELHQFTTPETVPNPYAILSHVWDKEEQSFQDVHRVQQESAKGGLNPRDGMCLKIRKCCELAERHGYRWLWIDTCCIDKTSSAELSEAINSMYRYYSLSDICYAYLRDVPLRTHDTFTTDFSKSRWHTRGWTLQELLAPPFVLFLSKSWEPIGSKGDLATDLHQVTSIPVSVLRLDETMDSYSVAQRMSWAANRETTRVEDRAYSLLGLFHVNMPTLYGEGSHAFERLQEEILRRSPDTTLFAWGEQFHFRPLKDETPSEDEFDLYFTKSDPRFSDDSYAFASSPEGFVFCPEIVYRPPCQSRQTQTDDSRLSPGELIPTPSLTVTPIGVQAHVPVVNVNGTSLVNLYWVMLESEEGPLTHCMLLLSHASTTRDSTHPIYYISKTLSSSATILGAEERSIRVVFLSPDEYETYILPKMGTNSWQTIHLAIRPPSSPTSIGRYTPSNNSYFTPYRIPTTEINAFLTEIPKWRLAEPPIANRSVFSTRPFHTELHFLSPGDYSEFLLQPTHIILQVGQCVPPNKGRSANGAPDPTALWAHIGSAIRPSEVSPTSKGGKWVHNCSKNGHVSDWKNLEKTFRGILWSVDLDDAEDIIALSVAPLPGHPPRYMTKSAIVNCSYISVTLSFVPCKINPQSTLILRIRVTDRYVTTERRK